jgi:hypothetical protein
LKKWANFCSGSIWLNLRVTRLGELSPTSRFLTVGVFFANFKSTQNFGLHFSHSKIYICMYSFWQKWIGLQFGHFFIISSGHPAQPVSV